MTDPEDKKEETFISAETQAFSLGGLGGLRGDDEDSLPDDTSNDAEDGSKSNESDD